MSASQNNLPEPILLLVNGHSRRGKRQFEEAIEHLKGANVPIKETRLAVDKAETERLLRREIEAGARTVIIGGGDGTLSLCAGFLAGTSVAMGVLPLGTGNTFARSLGIPLGLADAAHTIAAGHVESVDVGRVNDQVFLNSVSLGLSCEIVEHLNARIKAKLGLLAWPYVGLRAALKYRPIQLRITSPERQFALRTHQFVVANGRYVAGAVKAAPDASVQNALLTVFALGGADKTALFKAASRWMTNRKLDWRGEHFFESRHVRIESMRRTLRANVDGELTQTTPLEIEIWPGGLRVVVPEGFVADEV